MVNLVRFRTAAMLSQKSASISQENWAFRIPPCDVAIARRCEFVRLPYDLLRLPCVSNRKRLQGCRMADVNQA